MKTKKQIVIGIIMVLIMLIIPTITKAGLVSKPGGTLWTNVTISDAYDICYNLRNSTSTLGTNSLDPHLALNKDWGAAAYLALSMYGNVESSSAPTVSIDSQSYTTTTGNETGILNMGLHYEWTSGMIDMDYEEPEYRESLKSNISTKYVENLSIDANKSIENSKGMAFAETSGWFGADETWGSERPFPCLRRGVFGFGCFGLTGSERWRPDLRSW